MRHFLDHSPTIMSLRNIKMALYVKIWSEIKSPLALSSTGPVNLRCSLIAFEAAIAR